MRPALMGNASNSPARSLLRSRSLPRFRSQPIHTPWRLLKMRCRWSSRKKPFLGEEYLTLSSSISRIASSTSAWESLSRGLLTESGRSVSRAQCRFGSRLARKRISRSVTSSRTCFSFSNREGTTTSVVHSWGIPLLKSSRGSGSGSKKAVTVLLTRSTASCVAGSSNTQKAINSATKLEKWGSTGKSAAAIKRTVRTWMPLI